MFPQDSTFPNNTAAAVSTTQPHDWDATGWVPDKPAHWEYGYVIKGQTYSSTREQLPKILEERAAEIEFVWTPETPAPVFPERVPFLIEVFRRIQVKGARSAIWIGAGLLVCGVLFTVVLDDWTLIVRTTGKVRRGSSRVCISGCDRNRNLQVNWLTNHDAGF